MPPSDLHEPILSWYAESARSLPWRQPGTTPWEVLVSEVMLQQTPVARVLAAYEAWVARWPTAPVLAAESPGEAVRMWGRLGYPRRALRLHAAAVTITSRHDGDVPATYPELRALPGVGDYTAAAVLAFGHGKRTTPLDTNVRRVLARLVLGIAAPAGAAPRAAERRMAARLLPDDQTAAATWAVAVMELGALVCRSRSPACAQCPVRSRCAWRRSEYTPRPRVSRPSQAYAGSNRQCRGTLLAFVSASPRPVPRSSLSRVWNDESQRDRALASLLDDGLLATTVSGDLALPRNVASDVSSVAAPPQREERRAARS